MIYCSRVALMTNPNSEQFPVFQLISKRCLSTWVARLTVLCLSLSLFLNLFPSYLTRAHQLFQYTFLSSCYKFHLPEMTSERCCGPLKTRISFIKKIMWNYYYIMRIVVVVVVVFSFANRANLFCFVVYNNNLRHCSYKQTSSSFILSPTLSDVVSIYRYRYTNVYIEN